ncbi:tautomerase family protein [Sphingomonas xanthus]|uniref:tautomerase family protein n=1 Tax=Sphingomonas xanthus TaxID=2594473 RepID=UPI001FE76BD2|nr:tautomerase family protein [Sphingomonas xanthus]
MQITVGATRDQKQRLVAEITRSLVDILGKKPEHTHIIIQEIEEENWGYFGMLTDEFRARER